MDRVRQDFAILRRRMNGQPLVYLDNAATAQKPAQVIDRMSQFYRQEYATVHRGVYALSQDSTVECELVREKCRKFLNASDTREIIFVRGATEAINLVATAYGRKFFQKGDEIVISCMEHHSNIVPWQRLCEEKELRLRVIPISDRGEILMGEYRKLLGPRTRLVAVTHVSNVLGTINAVREIALLARQGGSAVLIDGAQSAPHLKIDVQDLGCDFFCFSGHKLYGPTGVGVLYGKLEKLSEMDPYQFGGDMIESVSFDKTSFAELPAKFEAGTPPITQIVGLGAALDYLEGVGFEKINLYEGELLKYATERLSKIEGLTLLGTAPEKTSVISFVIKDIHPHDLGTLLDQEGIAIRAGHHCAQPLMRRFHVPATARVSLAFYNTREEVDILVKAIEKAKEIFR